MGKDRETRRNKRKAVKSNKTEKKVEKRWRSGDFCPPCICATKQLKKCMSLTEVRGKWWREKGKVAVGRREIKAMVPWCN
jgi:hypothetical protein